MLGKLRQDTLVWSLSAQSIRQRPCLSTAPHLPSRIVDITIQHIIDVRIAKDLQYSRSGSWRKSWLIVKLSPHSSLTITSFSQGSLSHHQFLCLMTSEETCAKPQQRSVGCYSFPPFGKLLLGAWCLVLYFHFLFHHRLVSSSPSCCTLGTFFYSISLVDHLRDGL